MRVLIAPDAFAGALTAGQVAAALAQGWAEAAPADVLTALPLSDGGAGFVDVLAAALDGDLVPVTVHGPTGVDVPAAFMLSGSTAYVVVALVLGVHLDPRRDPARTSSAGLAVLMRAAVAAGATRVVLGCGPAACHDGGAGLLGALGAGDEALLGRGGAALADLPDGALGSLAAVRAQWAGVELVVASTDELPLLGFHGLSATLAETHGADAVQAQQLEAALGRFADVAQRSLVAGRVLMGRGLAAAPGSGAGGGAGFALLLLGATRVSGVQVVLEAVGLDAALAGADVVVTATAAFDGGTLHEGVVPAVARAALARGVPAVVVAQQVEVGRREALAIGVAGTYAVVERPAQAAASGTDPAGELVRRTRRVARTWSR